MRIRNHTIFRNKEIEHILLNEEQNKRNMICDEFRTVPAEIQKT